MKEIIPFTIDIDEYNEQQFEKRKSAFFKIVGFKINSLPIKKHIIDILRTQEGNMFSDLFRTAVLEDIRVYARYSTIAVKGYNEKNDTLYIFKNKNATTDKILYITIDRYEEEDICPNNEIVYNVCPINKDILYVLRMLFIGYMCMGVLIGFNYLSTVK